MILELISMPDISFAVNVASRALDKPNLAKRIVRYMKGTQHYGLLYHNEEDLKVFSDANFARDVKTQKSTVGAINKTSGVAV